MAKLRPCRDCGHMVSSKTDDCPWCGTSKPAQRFLLRHPVIGVLVFGTFLYGAVNALATIAEAAISSGLPT